MKFIFDFDDVLFYNTKKLKERIYLCLENAGVPRKMAEEYYKGLRLNCFSLKHLLAHFSLKEETYDEIMKENKNFINEEMFELIKKLGKGNCYIVSYGDKEYNTEKIMSSGVSELFHPENIFILSGSKKDTIEKICLENQNEEVVFIDDKALHFENLDFKKFPNLKTILFDEKGLEKLKAILPHS